jgi:hypothetical protein
MSPKRKTAYSKAMANKKKTNRKPPKSKEEMEKFIRRFYYLLRHHSDRIYFQRLSKNVYGYYDYGTEEITVDYRREMVPTLIHEAIHHWHPDWPERAVLKEERDIVNSLTPRQYKNILRVLVENIQ